VWGGSVPSPEKSFCFGASNSVSFCAFWVAFLTVQPLVSYAKTGGLDLPKYARTSPVVLIFYLGYVNNNNGQF